MDKKLINIENDLNQIKFILERLVSSKYKFIVDIKIYVVDDSGYFFCSCGVFGARKTHNTYQS